jgi:hypothetical protein
VFATNTGSNRNAQCPTGCTRANPLNLCDCALGPKAMGRRARELHRPVVVFAMCAPRPHKFFGNQHGGLHGSLARFNGGGGGFRRYVRVCGGLACGGQERRSKQHCIYRTHRRVSTPIGCTQHQELPRSHCQARHRHRAASFRPRTAARYLTKQGCAFRAQERGEAPLGGAAAASERSEGAPSWGGVQGGERPRPSAFFRV